MAAPAGQPQGLLGMERPARLVPMRSETRAGPFRPGRGRPPPYLAGREEEQDYLRMLLADLDRGRSAPSEVILDGPPGNGKTALLGWVREAARASTRVDVETLTPSEFDSSAGLAELLMPASRWKTARDIIRRPAERSPAPNLTRVLDLRVGRKPLALLIDEAQTLDRKTGCALLNAAQKVGRSAPFLLVLAGTPNLRDHLSTMGASFWGRGRQYRIGRLDERATADAIRKPLEADDITITDDALEHIARESEGYPFFVQLWGEAVWSRAAAESAERVTSEDARACQAAFDEQRNTFCRDRCGELEKLRLLRPARAVAEAFESRPVLTDSELEAAIRQGLGESLDHDEVAAAEDRFLHSGLVWNTQPMPVNEPGLPGLLEYILRAVPAP